MLSAAMGLGLWGPSLRGSGGGGGGGALILQATFTAPDATDVHGYTAETGQVATGPGWTITSGRAVSVGVLAPYRFDAGVPNGRFRLDLLHASAQQYLAMAMQDADNNIIAGFQANETLLRAWKEVGGAFTELDNAEVGAHVGTIEVTKAGGDYTVTFEGPPALSFSEPTFASETGVGAWGDGAVVDNQEVWS